MIYAINYADDKFKSAQKFNTKMAKRYGARKVIEYSPESIDKAFKEKNASIWNSPRGGGYWIWKPYIIYRTLKMLNTDDYLVYSDSGSCFIDDIQILINAMEKDKKDIMLFSLHSLEKNYSKRDAFILMDCDKTEFIETPQRCATYMIYKKNDYSLKFVEEWLKYAQDERIITNNENVMGKPDYQGFVENRHDQTILSLLSKKWGIEVFRDPCQYGNDMKYPEDVLARSPYGQIIDSHRYRIMPKLYFTYKHIPREVYERWIAKWG